MKRIFRLIAISALISPVANAGVNTSGMFDFRYSDGQPGANYGTGNYHSASPTFGVGQLSVFVDGDIDENMFFSAEFEAGLFQNITPTNEENYRLRKASVTILNMQNSGASLEVGRFDTIAGAFAERRLPLQNPLIDNPLMYSYRVNLFADGGFVPNGENRELSMVDKNMTQTGMKLFGHMKGSKLHYALSITNNAPATPMATNGDNSLGTTARLAWVADRDTRFGLSISDGSWMRSFSLNGPALPAGPLVGKNILNEYRQSLFSGFWDQRWHRFDVHAEYMKSGFDVPNLPTRNATLDVTGYYGEVKYSFTRNLFAAGRFGAMDFEDNTFTTINAVPRTWDTDLTRTELGIGTFVNENALAKLSWQSTNYDVPNAVKPDYDVISGSLSVAF